MNAGAYGEEIGEKVVYTKYIDESLEIKILNNEEHKFAHRDSAFSKNNYIILGSKIKLQKKDKEQIKQKMEENAQKRKDKQPLNYPSAGSTFKRGPNYITAELIDKAGLKGYNINDVYVSEKHAGFIVNKGNATAKDILDLIEYVRNTVYEKFKVKIELEVKILGED